MAASCNITTVLGKVHQRWAVEVEAEALSVLKSCVCVCVAAMKADRKRLKVEKADLASQMQQLYTTLESREEQLREFIRNYDQHRKVAPARAHGRIRADHFI